MQFTKGTLCDVMPYYVVDSSRHSLFTCTLCCKESNGASKIMNVSMFTYYLLNFNLILTLTVFKKEFFIDYVLKSIYHNNYIFPDFLLAFLLDNRLHDDSSEILMTTFFASNRESHAFLFLWSFNHVVG